MRRVALRGIRSHLGRFTLSVLAVLLGVAFVAGTFSLRTMMSTTFTDLVESSMVGDAYLRGVETASESDATADLEGGNRTRIPIALAEEAQQVDGVELVLPEISGPMVLVGADGTAVSSGGGPPSFGAALYPEDPSAWVVDGRAPAGPEEIGLESATLEASGLTVGDTTTVVRGDALQEVEVVGEIGFGAPVAGATIVLLDVDTAIASYAADGTVATMAVYAEDGVTEAEVVERLDEALAGSSLVAGSGLEVETGETLREETRAGIESILGFVSTFLLIFAGIALFVGAFIIANTFQMTVRQRQREFAMLRAIGASPGQVFTSILVQAGVVGVLGSALGVGAGVGLVSVLRGVFASMGMELSGRIPLDTFIVLVSVGIGTVVSLVAAAIPARKAALTPPVEAMRDELPVHDRASTIRTVLGGVLVAGGVGAVAAAVLGTLDEPGSLLGLGAAGVVVGALLLAPSVVPVALGALAAPVVALLKPLGGLARGNVTRNPRRTASTAGALMIGMALVGAAAVLAASTQASTRTVVENESTSDYLLQSATMVVPAELAESVGSVEGVDHADVLRYSALTVDDESSSGIGIDPEIFDRALSVEVIDGDLGSLADGSAAVQQDAAEENGWTVGTQLDLRGSTGSRTVTVGAVINSGAMGTSVILPDEVFGELVAPSQAVIDTVFVTAEPGADLADVRAGLVDLAKPYVVISVMDNEEFADAIAEQVDQILVILYALLGLSIVIAVLGIVNTLALSIAERTREIGLLRAVGLGRLQLASVVTIESVLTALFGTLLGIGIGAGLASTLPTVFADEGLSTLVVPWSQLGVVVGLALLVGVLAAVWPAVRAARMDVLDAVAYE